MSTSLTGTAPQVTTVTAMEPVNEVVAATAERDQIGEAFMLEAAVRPMVNIEARTFGATEPAATLEQTRREERRPLASPSWAGDVLAVFHVGIVADRVRKRPRSRTQPTAQGRLTKVGRVAEAVGVETAESTEVESVNSQEDRRDIARHHTGPSGELGIDGAAAIRDAARPPSRPMTERREPATQTRLLSNDELAAMTERDEQVMQLWRVTPGMWKAAIADRRALLGHIEAIHAIEAQAAAAAVREADALREERDWLLEQIDWAWAIIANASRGNWELEYPDWQGAATKWRDATMPRVSALRAALSAEPAAGEREP